MHLCTRVNLEPVQPSKIVSSWYMNLEQGPLGLIGVLAFLESTLKLIQHSTKENQLHSNTLCKLTTR